MKWILTEENESPVGVKVLAYFELNDEYSFMGYAVVSRVRFRKMSGWISEYWYDIPGENFADTTAPLRWCFIEDESI